MPRTLLDTLTLKGWAACAVAPDWDDGLALSIGGLAGGYTGARLQSRIPDLLIRRLVGILVIGVGVYYLASGMN